MRIFKILILPALFLSAAYARAQDPYQAPPTTTPSGTLLQIPQRDLPGFGAIGNLGLNRVTIPTLIYSGWLTPQQDPTDVEQQRLSFQTPVYNDGVDWVDVSAGGSSLHFGQEQFLSSGVAVPIDLWKAEVGGGYSRIFESGKFFGVRAGVGSASDHPFSTLDVITFSVTGYYAWPGSERSTWTATLFYSNNNPIANGIPIPGIVYRFHSANFVGMFGLPFSAMVWLPDPSWMFAFSFFGPTINSEIAYGNPRKLQLFTGWSWTQQSYLRVSRPDPNDRLYYVEMHAPVGVRVFISNQLKAEFSVGYSFDRSVYEGTHFTSADDGRTNLGASFYGAWNLRMQL